MPRALRPGRWSYDQSKAVAFTACTGGGCRQGRMPGACDCELSNVVPLRPRSMVLIRPAITVHRIPFSRRVRRFLRALFHFFTARKADLS